REELDPLDVARPVCGPQLRLERSFCWADELELHLRDGARQSQHLLGATSVRDLPQVDHSIEARFCGRGGGYSYRVRHDRMVEAEPLLVAVLGQEQVVALFSESFREPDGTGSRPTQGTGHPRADRQRRSSVLMHVPHHRGYVTAQTG